MTTPDDDLKDLLVSYKPLWRTLQRFSNGLALRLGYSHSLYKMSFTSVKLYREFLWEIEDRFYKFSQRTKYEPRFPPTYDNTRIGDNDIWDDLWEDEKPKGKNKYYEFNQKEKMFLKNLQEEVERKVQSFVKPAFYLQSNQVALSKFKKHFDKLIYNINEHQRTAFLKEVGNYTADNEMHGFASD
jgi:hypothetical protein